MVTTSRSVFLYAFLACVWPGWATLAEVVPVGNRVFNGEFERGLEGWRPFWGGVDGEGNVELDCGRRHGGGQSLRIDHCGEGEWTVTHAQPLAVHSGDLYELSGWVRREGKAPVKLCVITRDAKGEVKSWNHGEGTMTGTGTWVRVQSRFLIPAGIMSLQPCIKGSGAGRLWLDDVALCRRGCLDDFKRPDLPSVISVGNDVIDVVVRTQEGVFEIRDKRAARSWIPWAEESPFVVAGASRRDDGIEIQLLDPVKMKRLTATLRLEGKKAECVVSLQAEGEMTEPIAWPVPMMSAKGQLLIVPVNEGISYPVDDPAVPPVTHHLYGGHGLCMPWYGAVDGDAGWQVIVETADDAAVQLRRCGGFLCLAPEWQAQKGRFGQVRVMRYVVFDHGGYVAMAKRYREQAAKGGLLRTLKSKKEVNPNVDLLVGAVNVWCFTGKAADICNDMHASGIQRILWSCSGPPDQLRILNSMGVLTSRYDLYQDAMNPENYHRLLGHNSEWTSEAWKNDDLVLDGNGDWVRGWEVEARDGGLIPCGVLCDRQALAYARQRIPAELSTHPYRCRFIDTTTASAWRECYHSRHPMTRTQSKESRMELLRYVSEGCGLVCGSETGHDAAVPYVHYFEGMMSLGPYRVPDSGRDMLKAVDEVPEPVAKFQTGHVYRLPLWELVYHDCVVAQWYWGDYNNKLPKLWTRRDLWNALYGTPPMFVCDPKIWAANKARFVRSYQASVPVARATGYSEMLSHEWLTTDHAVQRTRFANGVSVVVNFGNKEFRPSEGQVLPPLEKQVEGLDQVTDGSR